MNMKLVMYPGPAGTRIMEDLDGEPIVLKKNEPFAFPEEVADHLIETYRLVDLGPVEDERE